METSQYFFSEIYRIMVQDHLDWHQGDSIVVSSSSYEAHQAEIITLEKVNNRSIRIRERLLHRHIGMQFVSFA